MTDASLSFHPLSFLPDRKDAGVVVGRRDSESFAILDADSLLERMVSGMPPVRRRPGTSRSSGWPSTCRTSLSRWTNSDSYAAAKTRSSSCGAWP